MKWLISLLVLFLLIPIASAQTTEYTPSTQTVCNGATCTKTLYSGTMFVFEDEAWKPVEEANSLVGIWDLLWPEIDPDFAIENITYNYSGIDFDVQFTGDPLDYPTECSTYKSECEFKCQFKVQYKENGTDIKFDYKYELKDCEVTQNTNKFSYKGVPLGRNFSFGGNSTTIQLQDANTENLEDTYVDIDNANTNYESNTYCRVYNNKMSTYMKFNLSSIPTGCTIEDANLTLKWNIGGGSGHKIHHVNNYTWTEDLLTFNNQPCGGGNLTIDETKCNYTSESTVQTNVPSSGYHRYSITNMVKKEYDAGQSNISFIINASSSTYYYSKDSAGTKPYVDIRYTYNAYPEWFNNQSSVPSEYNPSQTFNFNITWNASDSTISNVSWVYLETNLTGTATNYTMSNETWGSGIYNWTYSTSHEAAQYYWKSWANDTNGIWNETDTWYFTIAQNASNPTHVNITHGGVTYIDQAASATSTATVTLNGYLNYTSSGTATLYVNGVQYAMPDSRTWGVGTYNITINTTGNANYTANATGGTFVLTITEYVPPAGGGGGGGGYLTIPPGACNVTTIPRYGVSGCDKAGTDIYPFRIQILNKNLTQTFTFALSGDIAGYCELDTLAPVDVQPYGRVEFYLKCTAPEGGPVTGNIDITSNLGCSFAIPVSISDCAGVFAEMSNAVKLLSEGDIIGFLTATIANIPVYALIIAAAFIVVIVFYRW